MLCLRSVQNVENCFLVVVIWWDITDLYMKVSSFLVISVIITLQIVVIFGNIFSINMKVSSILVISAIIKLFKRIIWRDTFSLNMRTSLTCINFTVKSHSVSCNLSDKYISSYRLPLVISVFIKLQDRTLLRNKLYQQGLFQFYYINI